MINAVICTFVKKKERDLDMNKVKFSIYIVLTLVPLYFIANIYGIFNHSKTQEIVLYADLQCPFEFKIRYIVLPKDDDLSVIVNLITRGDIKKCKYIEYDFKGLKPDRIVSHDSQYYNEDIGQYLIRDNKSWEYKLIGNKLENEKKFYRIMFTFNNFVNKLDYSTSEIITYLVVSHYQTGHEDDNKYITYNQSGSRSTTFLMLRENLNLITPKIDETKIYRVKGNSQYQLKDKPSTTVRWIDPKSEKNNIIVMLILTGLFGVGMAGVIELFISKVKKVS